MEALRRKVRQELMKRQFPDMLHVQPPTELAVKKMVRNLHAAAKKSDKS